MCEVRSAFGFLVQTPFGPRKSGIPLSVEMPAPVSTTMALAAWIHERAVDRTDGSTTEISAIGPGYGRTDGAGGGAVCRFWLRIWLLPHRSHDQNQAVMVLVTEVVARRPIP